MYIYQLYLSIQFNSIFITLLCFFERRGVVVFFYYIGGGEGRYYSYNNV